ncbi:MAG: 2-polyprenyl-6-methoxyphenol hydroxylase [Robiginitomaculum sp.]|nr:MAG: 2-polyprenyl-6-methoxyphenol hydroxylase [Robiginitomaculum sp.]
MTRCILVVGAGIGGLTAAIALVNRGADVEIIEKYPESVVYGVGLCQPGNALRAIKDIGLLDECYANGLASDFTEWRRASGSLIAKTPHSRLADPTRPAYNNIGRPALQNILLKEARRLGLKPRMGITADQIETEGDGVNVTFSDGSHGQYDLVIGADGIRSQTRRILFGEQFEPVYTGHAVWRIAMPRADGVDNNMIYFGNGKKAGLIPLSDGKMYFWVVVNRPGNKRIPKEDFLNEARKDFSGFGGIVKGVADTITDDTKIVYSPIEEVVMPLPWSKGRVVLIGDAAHASGPHLGQGAAMAMEDAVVASELFASSIPIDQAITKFEQRRFPRAKFIQDETRLMGERGQMSGRIKCFIRNHLILPAVLPRSTEAIEKKIGEPI